MSALLYLRSCGRRGRRRPVLLLPLATTALESERRRCSRRQRALDEHVAATLEIHSRRRALRVMNDGEALLLAPPLRYAIRPGALRVIVPAAAAERVAAGDAQAQA